MGAICQGVGMTEREEKVVGAAIRVIMRYGMKRTTMNDIAEEAGISRQTLYTMFSSKDEVLQATIRLLADRSLEAIASGCAKVEGLGNKLDVAIEHLAVRPYRMLSETPDAGDIIIGFNAAAREEIAVATERYREAIESMLMPYEGQIRGSGLTVHALSDFIQNAVKGFKHEAESEQHLSALLNSLKLLVLNLLNGR